MKGFVWLTLALGLRAAQGDPEAPVTAVVRLLGDLQSRISKDGTAEQAKYDKFACWCEETTGKTAATITSVRQLLKRTGNTILKLKGSVATLSAEIAGLTADIKENLAQQEEQTNIREKENASFMAEKAETESALSALEKAITVLKAATVPGASFVQTQNAMSEVVSKMARASLSVKLSKAQLGLLGELSGKDASSYAPQSATIQGILGDMYTTFSKNLQTSTADEATSHRNYEDLMATYQTQLNTLQDTIVKKQQRKGEDEIQLADATQSYADAEEQLKAEVALFDATKESCTEKTTAWSKRSSARTAELAGITKALEILTSDEAKKTFADAIQPGVSKGAASFIQVDAISGTGQQKALQALEGHAQQSHSIRLAALAASVRMQSTGHFDEVIKTIDNLLGELQVEEQADIAKVDECKNSYQEFTSNKKDLAWKIENNKAKVQKHQKAIDDKTTAKGVVIKDIEDADQTLADMLAKRTEENGDYTTAKSDDEKAVGLLVRAKAALSEYFKKSLLQTAQEPDMRLSDKNSAKGQTDGVLALLDNIIEDLTSELAESKSAEAAAQTDYDNMKKAVEDQKDKLIATRINLAGQIAEEGTAKTAEKDLQDDNEGDLTTEETSETDLKKTCDDAIKNQPDRKSKRKMEADGLTQAKEFLAGAASDALIQTPKQDKSVFPTFQSLSFMQRRAVL